jgi:hypothetical protein
MESAELVDMIVSDAKSSEISDYIKNILHTKSSEKIDELKPAVAVGLFGQSEEEIEGDEDLEIEEEE